MDNKRVYLGIDVGNKRVGLAVADSIAKIAQPLDTIENADHATLHKYVHDLAVTDIVVGRPRNQAGDTTSQTTAAQTYIANAFNGAMPTLYWQDESVTSVLAEERLKARKKPYSKADIDAEAAAIILQDYLETV